MSMPMRSSVRAIVRVRLSPRVESLAFEWWLRAIPAVLSAVLVTGDVDYELQLGCRSFADLGDVLTRIRGYRGAEVDSTALVLHEVAGLGRRERAIPDQAVPDQVVLDEVTLRRLRNM
jgi:Lrp/AsnC family transcriptional regulator, leucine-responsive regulatory protein